MSDETSLSRRRLLMRLAVGVPLAPIALRTAVAADTPLLSVNAPAAKAVHYIESAKGVKEAQGNSCANCGLYQGPDGSVQGPCQIFPGKEVKAAGWCTSWAGQM